MNTVLNLLYEYCTVMMRWVGRVRISQVKYLTLVATVMAVFILDAPLFLSDALDDILLPVTDKDTALVAARIAGKTDAVGIVQKEAIHTSGVPAQTDQELEKMLYELTRNFAQVLQLIKDKHFQVHSIADSMNNAMKGLVSGLDPHSGYLEQKTYQMMSEVMSGEFGGIGVAIGNTRNTQDKFLTVVEVIPDGPADKAGLEPMDKIVEINGKSLENMTTEEAIFLLKGPKGTSVHVKVMRSEQQELLSFDIIRDIVKEQVSFSFYFPEHNIYYLSLTTFNESATGQIQGLLEKAAKNKYKALILDLRNNSGGLLMAAIDIVSLFVEKNSLVVITKDKHNKDIDRYYTSKEPIADHSLPIYVIINNYTASAAEILAGALKIHSQKYAQQSVDQKQKLAVFLVGTKSFGKGSVQEVIPVNNNCAVKLTTSLYYLPDNSTIQGVGIEPDFVVEKTFPPSKQMAWFTLNYGREQALDNHIKVIKEDAQGKEKSAAAEDVQVSKVKRGSDRVQKMIKALETDNQVLFTISLANMMHTAQTLCHDQVCNREKAVCFLRKHFVGNTLQLEEVK